MLPFAFADRSRWGGPKKVKRAVTLVPRFAHNATWVNAQDSGIRPVQIESASRATPS
jgi:hypothetical protein